VPVGCPARRRHFPWIAVAVIASVVSGPVVLFIRSPLEMLDEELHLPQAYLLSAGIFRHLMYADTLRLRVIHEAAAERRRPTTEEVSQRVAEIIRDTGGANEPILSMLPGYHAIVALPMAVNHRLGSLLGWQFDALLVARLASGGISLGLLAALVALCRRTGVTASACDPHDCDSLAASAWTAAIVLPFHWLVYTDMLAMLLIVTVVLAHAAGRPAVAGGLGILSMAVRQTTVALVATAPIIDLWDDFFAPEPSAGRPWAARLGLACRRHWATLVALAVFFGFVLINGRISVGPREAHAFQLTCSALVFSLAVFTICTVPLVIGSLWRLVRERPLRLRPRTLGLIVTAAAVGACSFTAVHEWNRTDTCPWLLRNHLIEWLEHASVAGVPIGRVGLFGLLVSAGMLLASTPLPARYAAFLTAAWLCSVAPFLLLEPRYSIPPIVLWLALRQRESESLERAQVTWGIAAGGLLAFLHASGFIFL